MATTSKGKSTTGRKLATRPKARPAKAKAKSPSTTNWVAGYRADGPTKPRGNQMPKGRKRPLPGSSFGPG